MGTPEHDIGRFLARQERDEAAYAEAETTCELVCAEIVCGFPRQVAPWNPDADDADSRLPIDGYRLWLYETERQDSAVNRDLYVAVMVEERMEEDWERYVPDYTQEGE